MLIRIGFAGMSVLVVSLCADPSANGDDWLVLDRNERVQMLRDYLRPHVHAALDRRMSEYEKLKTSTQIRAYQQRLRAEFVKSLGGFPAKTPLNARIVGKLSGDGYHAEKLIYESRPGFYVTAILYLPRTKPPYPGVLLPCGHSDNGKAAEAYQRASILLARNGIATLCYDPIGQGERKQILKLDDAGQLLPQGRFSSTSEHMIDGVAPILLGLNLATYRIWDGIRSIDLLCSRKDIDALRIGCTGNSGGGLMTSYLMALDDRIVAAAPSCFITTTRRKNESPGPGDAEQNIFGQIAYGMDHPDYILMRAPEPTLICSATRDYVPIEGAWDAYRQAKRLYTRLGFAEQVDMIEADEKHGFSQHLRVGSTRWMRRWLLNRHETVIEKEVPIHTAEQLQCSPEGQVLLMPSSRSIFDLNSEEADRLAKQRQQLRSKADKHTLVLGVRQLAVIRPSVDLPRDRVEQVGHPIRRDGYQVHKLILRPEENIELAALMFLPHTESDRAILYLHGDGKRVDAQPGGPIEKLVKKGQRVLAVDLRGFGETETTPWRYSPTYVGNNSAEYFIAYMLGRSLVGMRAEDIFTCARYLIHTADRQQVDIVAVGKAGIPALHAAACEPAQFGRIQLRGVLDSWSRVIDTPVTVDQLENTVHGALTVYDLPDLIDVIGRDNVEVIDGRDAEGKGI